MKLIMVLTLVLVPLLAGQCPALDLGMGIAYHEDEPISQAIETDPDPIPVTPLTPRYPASVIDAKIKKAGLSSSQKAVLYLAAAGCLVGGIIWSDAIQEQIDAYEVYPNAHAPGYLGKEKTAVLLVSISAGIGFIAAVH